MPSYWKRYLSASRRARAKLDRRTPLSEEEVEELEQIKQQSRYSEPSHVQAIERLIGRSEAITSAWNPNRSLSPTWEPRRSIDDKRKTGDQEHFAIIWTAHRCIVSGESSDAYTERRARRDFARAMAARVADEHGLVLDDMANRLAEISGELDPDFEQFVVNLALFDFRTAGGGRARKTSNWLRMSRYGSFNEIGYLRPFDDPLPDAVATLLSRCDPNSLSVSTSVAGARRLGPGLCHYMSRRYVPPTRFTATFPLILAGNEVSRLPTGRGNVLTYVDPQFQAKQRDPGSSIKYAFMGSFGFSEPGYTTWAEEDEYAGTRLSLGAYSLDPHYLGHLCHLTEQALRTEKLREGYRGYGSVGLTHLRGLLAVAQATGHKLAFVWALDMARIAKALVEAAEEQARRKNCAGLVNFLGFVKAKISRRRTKLKHGAGHAIDELSTFEYIWVQESALWELAFIGASCLSPAEMRDALQRDLGRVMVSATASESICEKLRVELGSRGVREYLRMYGPSGTAAATQLFETLGSMGFVAHGVVADKASLNTFKPYFEFYQPGFLGASEVGEVNKTITSPRGTQVWVNLSDDLHAHLLDEGVPHDQAGGVIGGWLIEHVNRVLGISTDVFLVVDFTKFAGEMPNTVLLPLLAQLNDTLMDTGAYAGVAFLRSTLKYNTGPLDRYQAGEVLVRGGERVGMQLSAILLDLLAKYFANGAPAMGGMSKGWGLNGQYISMMKKVYIMSEIIGTRRWELYATTWKN